jgi:hypothetical protein
VLLFDVDFFPLFLYPLTMSFTFFNTLGRSNQLFKPLIERIEKNGFTYFSWGKALRCSWRGLPMSHS